ncbi:hypothetical protein SAMD00019534_070990 [Acytostelium subglobosum LB1]|uniref:hypothetical protein n=1 Tax=Acytostelium subglobosum LB1 TaxID=1410327 RepID=UPI0006447B49|nr:hypothetical protein SAMD00019534_070990 [Acytostelium subglobosum LB1]GAM23924.1 hypothetical protein SAMD00019534_070990 [Acytostelium subglobosum LB1]|eukprot:XP_012752960.1 hypothetical protein SAMD00019534_070990 [Acytostelium subglobosum LB1]
MTSQIGQVDARYLSPETPKPYDTNQPLIVRSNKITSYLKSYPFTKLPYPQPNQKTTEGSFMFKFSGNRLFQSVYPLNAMVSTNCTELNDQKMVKLPASDVNTFIELIEENYRVHFYVDGLPTGEEFTTDDGNNTYILLGSPVGFSKVIDGQKRYFLYNHLNFNIEYKSLDKNNNTLPPYYVTKVTIEPRSINQERCADKINPLELVKDEENKMLWTYGQSIRYSNTPWEDRWNVYYPHSAAIEWSSTAIAFFITALECALLGLIMYRIFKNDSIGFVRLGESGWKSIYADVFRSPNNFMTFSVIIGVGMQIAVASFVLMVFDVAGLLSIANPGSFELATVLIFAFCGLFSGYASMRTYIMLGGSRKRHNAILNAYLVPFVIMILLFISRIQLWSNDYLYQPSASEVIFVLSMWLFLSCPLSLLSSYFVNSWPPAEYPFRPNHIPRMIPKAKWYANHYFHSLVFGFLPFAVIYAQINFIVGPMFYGFHVNNSYDLCIAFILLVINVLVLNMLISYYQLSREDYNWWWRSIIGPSCTSIYIFIFLLIYGMPLATSGTRFYYFMFCLMVSVMSAFFFSSIGFLGNLWFIKRIYSTLHFD